MKTLKYILPAVVILAAGLIFTSCDNESALEPSHVETISRYDFPEGSNVWDDIFYEIWHEYGPQFIYKQWTEDEFERSWVGGYLLSIEYSCEYLEDEALLNQFSHFIYEKAFRYMNADVSKRAFPQYFYLMHDFITYVQLVPIPGWPYMEVPYSYYTGTFNYNDFFDFWIFSPTEDIVYGRDLEEMRAMLGRLFTDYFNRAFDRNLMDFTPAGFETGMDYSTDFSVSSGDIDQPHYALARGFCHSVGPWFDSYGLPSSKPGSLRGRSDFLNYVNMLMYEGDNFDTVYADWPFIRQRAQIVVDYLKNNYGIDIKAVGRAINSADGL